MTANRHKFKFWHKIKKRMSKRAHGLGVIWEYLVEEWGIFDWGDIVKLQSTGLEDADKVEIFDGDIADSHYGIGKVYWNDRGWRFEFDIDCDGLWEMATGVEGKDFRVIGNIFQNPELLEK